MTADMSILRPRIVHGIGREPPEPEMVRAACNVAEWTNVRMGRHGGRNFHNVAPVEVLQVPYPIRGDLKARPRPSGLEEHEVRLDFVIGAKHGGTGWPYDSPTRGAAAVSANSLEIAMGWPNATTDFQRERIEAYSTYICAHEMVHAAYGLPHASRDPRGPCRADHISCYMRVGTWLRLPDGEGFDAREQAVIDQQTWLHKVPPARIPWTQERWREALAWVRAHRRVPEPVLDFSAFGTPAFVRAPSSVRNLIIRYFEPAEWENAAGIGERESGWDTLVIRDTLGQTDLPEGWLPEKSVGYFQINIDQHAEYTVAQMQDPEQNVAAAAKIRKVEGWAAWLYSARAIGIL